MGVNKTLLIITDGIGYEPITKFNAFSNAVKPTYDSLLENTPHSLIKTSGLAVGLPFGQMGNSEVGHMTIGSGRVLHQDLVKINLATKNDTLKTNKALKQTIKNSNDIHLIGLVSDGGVHSHIDHIISIAKICNRNKKNVYIHVITDGRDVEFDSAKKYVNQILDICNENIKIATISGRYYAMDRDNRWDRIEMAYRQIVEKNHKDINNEDKDILSYIHSQYNEKIYDEFIKPARFGCFDGINKNDGVIFCNFRNDRFREISNAIANEKFNNFKTVDLDLNFATMTLYDKNLPLPVMFEKNVPLNTLGDVISKNNLAQTHIAETEKYAHVTFFFNGGIEEKLRGEKRILVPSPNISTYDLKPQMSAKEVTKKVIESMENQDDFIVVNYANGDMVGHTGNLEASISAVECVDRQLSELIEVSIKEKYNILITSDHGNCEMMKDKNGKTLTNHTTNDVYCFVLSKDVDSLKNGGLNNIAPTILKLMNIDIPKEMDEALF